jgi:hypothetical protein
MSLRKKLQPITDYMELSLPREARSFAATEELSGILWNPKSITGFTRALHMPL